MFVIDENIEHEVLEGFLEYATYKNSGDKSI